MMGAIGGRKPWADANRFVRINKDHSVACKHKSCHRTLSTYRPSTVKRHYLFVHKLNIEREDCKVPLSDNENEEGDEDSTPALNKIKSTSYRPTNEQVDHILEYIASQDGLADGKYQERRETEEAKLRWNDLAGELNEMNGTQKTVDQWRYYWNTLRNRALTKARDQRRKLRTKVGFQLNLMPLEKRVMNLIDPNYFDISKLKNDPDLGESVSTGGAESLEDDDAELPHPRDSMDNADSFVSFADTNHAKRRKLGDVEYHPAEEIHVYAPTEIVTSPLPSTITKEAAMIFAKAAEEQSQAAKINSRAMVKLTKGIEKLDGASSAQTENNAAVLKVLSGIMELLNELKADQ